MVAITFGFSIDDDPHGVTIDDDIDTKKDPPSTCAKLPNTVINTYMN